MDGDAGEMIDETRRAVLLKGFRGGKMVDMRALERCLVDVYRFLYEHPEIHTLDINALIVLKQGQGCIVVDARMLS